MKRALVLCLVAASVAAGALSRDASAFYGRHATEAELTFETDADLLLPGNPTVDSLNADGRGRTAALAKLDDQIQHLMGTFQSQSFRDAFRYPGTLGESYDIRFTRVAAGSAQGRKRLSYRFKGKVVFQKEAFSDSDTRDVPLKLPLAPDLIYALGVRHGVNLCTDSEYNSEGDFWYFWDPDQAGCPLKGNDTDVLRFNGQLRELPNTTLTYPSYDKLYGDNANGDSLEIDVFFGLIDDVDSLAHHSHRDDGAKAMRYVEQELRSRGFALKDQKDAFREYSDGRTVQGINYLRHYEKTVHALGHDLTVRVQIFLGDTMITSNDETFHHYYVPALRSADVLVYDGHSGLGGNLDLRELPRARMNPDKYQIMFFNGCSSYPYYNGMYFDAHGGSRNLDVVTSGLETLTDSSGPNALTFISPFLDGTTPSWQTLLGRLEASNGDDGTYLTGVNGDENDHWQP